jgi:hypothetical protein
LSSNLKRFYFQAPVEAREKLSTNGQIPASVADAVDTPSEDIPEATGDEVDHVEDGTTGPRPDKTPSKRFMCKHCFFETALEAKIRQHVESCRSKNSDDDDEEEEDEDDEQKSTVRMLSCVHCEFKTVVQSEIGQHVRNVHREYFYCLLSIFILLFISTS